jgi:hypothetical protein
LSLEEAEAETMPQEPEEQEVFEQLLLKLWKLNMELLIQLQ